MYATKFLGTSPGMQVVLPLCGDNLSRISCSTATLKKWQAWITQGENSHRIQWCEGEVRPSNTWGVDDTSTHPRV